MGVSAVLHDNEVTVDPGRDARCQVVLRNTGAVVDQYLLSVLGDAAEWAKVHPEKINLLPNEETYVDVVFSPPRGHEVLAGAYPFALQVVSREDEGGSVVQEGTVTLTGFTQLDAQLVPKTARGRRKGKSTLAVDNLGNYRLSVAVLGTNEDDLLVFKFRPRSPSTEPGTATFLKIRAIPRKHFWRGGDRAIPYRLVVRPEIGNPLAVDGVYVQRPLLPRRSLLLIPILFGLLLLVAMLLATLRQQHPVSMAGPSPTPTAPPTPTGSAGSGAGASATGSGQPGSGAGGAGGAGGSGSGSGSGESGGGASGSGGTGSLPGQFTIRAAAYPGIAGTEQLFSYDVPDGTAIALSEVHFTDSQDDKGTLQVRAGDTIALSENLPGINGVDYRFDPAIVVQPGEQVTLAVDCDNSATTCQPVATFDQSAVS
jgi:hypothetical protein